MSRSLRLGLAGLLMIAPTLLAQQRARPVARHPVMAVTPPNVFNGEGFSRTGRIVTFALMGGVVGGAIAYYTGDVSLPGCPLCGPGKARVLKGAAIGGAIGLAVGAMVVYNGGKPRVELQSARPRGR